MPTPSAEGEFLNERMRVLEILVRGFEEKLRILPSTSGRGGGGEGLIVTLNLFQGLSLLKLTQKFFVMFISIISSDANMKFAPPPNLPRKGGEELKTLGKG